MTAITPHIIRASITQRPCHNFVDVALSDGKSKCIYFRNVKYAEPAVGDCIGLTEYEARKMLREDMDRIKVELDRKPPELAARPFFAKVIGENVVMPSPVSDKRYSIPLRGTVPVPPKPPEITKEKLYEGMTGRKPQESDTKPYRDIMNKIGGLGAYVHDIVSRFEYSPSTKHTVPENARALVITGTVAATSPKHHDSFIDEPITDAQNNANPPRQFNEDDFRNPHNNEPFNPIDHECSH